MVEWPKCGPDGHPDLEDSVTIDEGVLDPWITEQLASNPALLTPMEDTSPEILALARTVSLGPPTVEIDQVVDDTVAGVPVRLYTHATPAPGVVVYFHGGGFVLGGIEVMDGVARELARTTGAPVVSVGYRLAPEDPFPAGLDDCEAVTRWAIEQATTRFGAPAGSVVVAGESAGGNLAAAVALRLREAAIAGLAGQVLIYPGADGRATHYPSRDEFDGLVLSRAQRDYYWASYGGGRSLDDEPFAALMRQPTLAGLPPALVVLGGCDVLRDEGRAYAQRLAAEGVDTEEVCIPGQPHGFVNFGFPGARPAYAAIGRWTRDRLGGAR